MDATKDIQFSLTKIHTMAVSNCGQLSVILKTRELIVVETETPKII
jgi:hypothetical protein